MAQTSTPVDLLPFYARHPAVGRVLRLVGLAALAGVIVQEGRVPAWVLPAATVALLLLWLLAWWLTVGVLWRGSTVAALLAAFVLLSLRLVGA